MSEILQKDISSIAKESLFDHVEIGLWYMYDPAGCLWKRKPKTSGWERKMALVFF